MSLEGKPAISGTVKPDPFSSNALAFLLRFVVIVAAMSALVYSVGADLIEELLPAIRAEVEWLDGTYAIDDIRLDHEGADRVVRIQVHQARCLVFESRTFCGDPRGWASASTLVSSSLLVVVLTTAIAGAWPAARWREYLWRGLLLAPALAFASVLDAPMLLWGAVWNMHHAAFAPGSFSPLLAWVEFMQGGGRLAVCIGLAVGIVVAARQVSAQESHDRPSVN